MPRARKIPRSEWKRNKQSICALFIDRDKSHEELVLSMAEEHGFHASKAQYIRQLGEWNIKKYSTKKDWKHADALVRKRKIDGKETEILMNGKLISAKKLKKELGRYGWQQTYDQSFTEDAPEGVIARTPPSSMPTSIRVRVLPWFQFRDELHLFAIRNSPVVPDQDPPRHDLSASGTQIALVPFVNEVLITRPLAKTTSDAVSLMKEQIPPMPELDPTTQVVHRDPDPWSLALQWAVYRCTNNLLRPDQVDELLRFASATGNLAVLKGICRMRGPTTMALLSRLLPSAVRLRDSALAEFFLHQGADPDAGDGTYWDWTSLQIAAEDHNRDIVQLLLEHDADPNHFNELDETPLHLALRKPGGLSIVKALVRTGGNLDWSGCEWSKSPLMVAIANHDLEAVRFLIEAGADLNFCSFSDGSALQIAVEARDVEMVKFLLESGANPNTGTNSHTSLPLQGKNARTALRLPLAAAVCKDMMMLQCLTRAGLDTSEFGWSQILQLFHFSSTTVLRGYLKRNGHVKNILTQPTQFQWQRSDLRQRQIIDLLLQAGADVNATPPSAPWGCAETPLQAAARSGDMDICSLFIYHGGDIHAPAVGRGGMTCLQAASMSEHRDLVYNLLLMGADVNALASSDGWTALQAATFSGSMETVELLLAWGSNVNHQSPSTALEIAIEQGHDALVHKLLHAGANINQCGTLGSALFNACRNRNLHLFDLLLALGAHPDPPACHVSPLMAAIEQEWQYGAQVLIQAGADVNKQCTKPSSSDRYNDWGWDWDLNVPLVAAVLTDEVEFVRMLFDAGAELDTQTSRCLEFAVQHRSNDIVRLLLEKGANPNQVSPGSKATTPIHIAVMCEDYELDTEVLKTLIEFGADVNASSGEGYPLEIISSEIMALGEDGFKDYDLEEARDLLLQAHANPGLFNHSKLQRAAEKGDIAQVRSLIANGEDVNEPANDNGGATALQYAAMHGHLSIAMLLIENGAFINAPRAKTRGRTALQGAAENGRLDMVYLLLEHDDEPELLAERRRDAARFADEVGHSLIRDILEGCDDHESSC
ncbi:hypothetical protein CDV31_013577 [Fusarium ambrosium]|uniref:Clr5 domain-containing protein n=1 Tax=Fusarium ambrosium TaxID=131363 RepID=A0A428T2A8_9HYPO|nr:hypothetical protein CDV31_013577 [Fusarium ambrosium]